MNHAEITTWKFTEKHSTNMPKKQRNSETWCGASEASNAEMENEQACTERVQNWKLQF